MSYMVTDLLENLCNVFSVYKYKSDVYKSDPC